MIFEHWAMTSMVSTCAAFWGRQRLPCRDAALGAWASWLVVTSMMRRKPESARVSSDDILFMSGSRTRSTQCLAPSAPTPSTMTGTPLW